jgi:hypothetical protein
MEGRKREKARTVVAEFVQRVVAEDNVAGLEYLARGTRILCSVGR